MDQYKAHKQLNTFTLYLIKTGVAHISPFGTGAVSQRARADRAPNGGSVHVEVRLRCATHFLDLTVSFGL